jgi:protein-tyrosine phosphatase
LWRQRATRLGLAHLVSSAGLDAQPGQPADAMCIEWLAERGLDLRAHRSQRLSLTSLARFELILAMEPGQLRRVRALAPLFAGRSAWWVG